MTPVKRQKVFLFKKTRITLVALRPHGINALHTLTA